MLLEMLPEQNLECALVSVGGGVAKCSCASAGPSCWNHGPGWNQHPRRPHCLLSRVKAGAEEVFGEPVSTVSFKQEKPLCKGALVFVYAHVGVCAHEPAHLHRDHRPCF